MMPKARSLFYTILFFVLTSGFAFAQTTDIIESVSPSQASPGDANVSVIINLDTTLTIPDPIPPTHAAIQSVTIGAVAAKSHSRDSEYVVSAAFDFPSTTPTGTFDLVLVFAGPQGDLTFTETGAFLIGSTGSLQVTISPADAVTAGAKWNVDGGAFQNSGDRVDGLTEGNHTVGYSALIGWNKPTDESVSIIADQTATTTGTYTETGESLSYPVVDTGQDFCSDDAAIISCPAEREPYYGQDAQHNGYPLSYTNNGDGTVTDNVTGLMWQQTTDTDGDGDIDVDDKMTQSEAKTYCENLTLAGYTDWRLPTIKESYSLIDFRGTDPSGLEATDTSGLVPFIDDTYFEFNFGDTAAGERIIDSQYASDTLYVDTSANNGSTMFGVNFADGRIKGYGTNMGFTEKTFFNMCVRGNTSYGVNSFVDNGDGTITDNATGLMWTQNDNGEGVNWRDALAWAADRNAAYYLGYNDWRLPNAKELQSIVDYDRSPGTSNSAAINPLFDATSIPNEAGQEDYPYYWTSTTHLKYNGSVTTAVYVSFGRAMGDYGRGDGWEDVHGAGAQRSDPKSPEAGVTYPNSSGPQGDAQRVHNYVRLVRDANAVQYTLSDAVTILRMLAGVQETSVHPDPTGDGSSGLEDVVAILIAVAGL